MTKLVEFVANFRVYSKNAIKSAQKQYNLLYGIEQNETLQRNQESLLDAAKNRRSVQMNLNEVQEKIRDTRNIIDKTPRNSDNYLILFQKEHDLIKREHLLLTTLKYEEEKEREMLSLFTENIRQSYEIDLVRQSRQKLLSFIYSIVGGFFGFSFSFYLNRYKNEFFTKEVDKIKDQHVQTLQEIHQMNDKLNEIIQLQIKIETENENMPVPVPVIEPPSMSYPSGYLLGSTIFGVYVLYRIFF